MADFGHSEIGLSILNILFTNRVLRSTALVDKVKDFKKLSNPTIYLYLENLENEGYIEKNKISKRNVQYELKPQGEKLVKRNCLKSKEAILAVLVGSPNREEIVIECLLENILKKLPRSWREDENKEKVRRLLTLGIKTIKEEILIITGPGP